MLNKKQLVDWFKFNGVDVSLSIPIPLFNRLLKNSKHKDIALFVFMKDFFKPHDQHQLILRFENWDELYTFYSYCVSSCSHSKLKS